LVRIRGYLKARVITGNTAVAGFQGAFGIGIINEAAFAAGAGSSENPVDDADWNGWIYHRFFAVNLITPTIADGVNAASVAFETEIDSKAMRKLKVGDVLFAEVQVVEADIAGLEVQHDSRFLVKLP